MFKVHLVGNVILIGIYGFRNFGAEMLLVKTVAYAGVGFCISEFLRFAVIRKRYSLRLWRDSLFDCRTEISVEFVANAIFTV